jgi:hypothetical protein
MLLGSSKYTKACGVSLRLIRIGFGSTQEVSVDSHLLVTLARGISKLRQLPFTTRVDTVNRAAPSRTYRSRQQKGLRLEIGNLFIRSGEITSIFIW